MKFSKKQRILFYNKALASILEEDYQGGLCSLLYYTSGMDENQICTDVLNEFPELLRYKPKYKMRHEHWWTTKPSGMSIRVSVLRKCIRQVKIKINPLMWFVYLLQKPVNNAYTIRR